MLQTLLNFLANWPAVTLVVGLFLLVWTGSKLVDASVVIAKRLGVSTLVVGLTIVAFGTSAPELAFNVIAAASDNSDLSFGNIIGSNIANLGLVLGLAATASTLAVHGRVVRIELPILGLVSAGVVATALFLPNVLVPAVDVAGTDRPDVPGFARIDGLILLAGFMFFLALMFRLARSNRQEILDLTDVESVGVEHMSVVSAVAVFVIALAGLVVGGKCAEIGAVGVASWLGISQSVIALTVVAIATSLPEVTTSLIAARRGQADMAVGNVIGSNLFNLLLIMGVTATVAPVRVPEYGVADLLVMLALTLLVSAIIAFERGRITRRAGITLLILYVSYLSWTVLR